MNSLPSDTRAMRREIFAAFIAFFVGFVAALVALGWLIQHFVSPESRWWEILHMGISSILISVLVGLACAALVVLLLNRYHYWRGYYLCRFCGRPLKRPGKCDCPERERWEREIASGNPS